MCPSGVSLVESWSGDPKRLPAEKYGLCWKATVWVGRALVVAGMVLWCANISAVDSAVAECWRWLLQQWWFRHDSFEPAISTLSFVLFVPFLGALDMLGVLVHKRWKGSKADKFILSFRTQPNTAGQNDMWKIEGDAVQEFLVYVIPIFTIDFFFPRRAHRLAVSTIPTSTEIATDILACLALYDFFFTIMHFVCHKILFLYKHIHAKHHDRSTVRARDTIRLTPLEETIDVLCSVAALNVWGAHQMSRGLYDVAIVWLLCELHCGWSAPWQLQHLVPGQLWGGSVRHTEHHANPKVYYQKFFTYLDDMLLASRGNGIVGNVRCTIAGLRKKSVLLFYGKV